ncbi:hypothetical protein [Polyangium aurulentum]|uniref:hypothetical protein n=1 Tax=Polyangium aurulentum TaxID=2567896 RepID=UPI00197F5B34|nr:hypothetical protein [Polyangium aurulentum]UQA56991.1 hypothetical protein E8A73_037725 [Polyangium aurulentum]
MDEPLAPGLVRHVLGRYREGLAESAGPDDATVAQGFLMPVLFGCVDRGATRTTFEQPIEGWEALLRRRLRRSRAAIAVLLLVGARLAARRALTARRSCRAEGAHALPAHRALASPGNTGLQRARRA